MNRPFVKPLSLTVAVMLSVSGCRSVQNAAYAPVSSVDQSQTIARPSAPALEPPAALPSRWPTRWGNNPDKPGTIIELDPADPLRPIHLSRFHQFRSTDIEYSDANQLAADIGITTGFKFKPEGPGSFLFIPNPKNESTPDLTKDTGKQSKSDIPDLAFKFVSATKIEAADMIPEITVTDDPDSSGKIGITVTRKGVNGMPLAKVSPDEDHVELQRTWFTYRDPKPNAQGVDPIGTIILLPGMFGTPDPIVDALENYWHHQGYAILRMRSHPSRFTESVVFRGSPEQMVRVAGKVARMNDDRVAEGAYATKAAVDYLFTKRSNLIDKPVILLGMSGGAMMLPTVYAYAPDHYDAAVLIAGGANFLQISLDSNYKSWIDAITFDFDPRSDRAGKITGEHRENFLGDYLKESKLDAYHTATEMADVPVLMLHASFDQAVPSSTGELLYRQLGQPERWTYPLSHELIFAGLPTQVARIDKWIAKELGIGQ